MMSQTLLVQGPLRSPVPLRPEKMLASALCLLPEGLLKTSSMLLPPQVAMSAPFL